MYLKTILELEEEGIVPLRARISERLHQSGPTVSQTVSRMERDGLVRVEGDRHLQLTAAGRAYAVSVMRKHRLAEREPDSGPGGVRLGGRQRGPGGRAQPRLPWARRVGGGQPHLRERADRPRRAAPAARRGR